MPISKPDFNLIFASQAPSQDLPAAFNNYARGWDEARKNNGKPTIKQFNYLIQQLDLKALWMIQNGAALPFDETVDYAEGAFTVKDGSLQQFIGGVWKKPTQTADQIFDETGKTQQEVNDLLNYAAYKTPRQFGGKPNDPLFDNRYALQAAFDSKEPILLDGFYYTTESHYVTEFQTVIGFGIEKSGIVKIGNKVAELGSVEISATASDDYNVDAILIIKAGSYLDGKTYAKYVTFKDFKLKRHNSVEDTDNLRYGLFAPRLALSEFSNFYAQNMNLDTGSVTIGTGIRVVNGWMLSWNRVDAAGRRPFHFGSDDGYTLGGGTSNTFTSCWARSGKVSAWRFYGMTYSNLVGCGGDYIGVAEESGTVVFDFQASFMGMINCSSEQVCARLIRATDSSSIIAINPHFKHGIFGDGTLNALVHSSGNSFLKLDGGAISRDTNATNQVYRAQYDSTLKALDVKENFDFTISRSEIAPSKDVATVFGGDSQFIHEKAATRRSFASSSASVAESTQENSQSIAGNLILTRADSLLQLNNYGACQYTHPIRFGRTRIWRAVTSGMAALYLKQDSDPSSATDGFLLNSLRGVGSAFSPDKISGQYFLRTTDNKPWWWTGTAWVDALGITSNATKPSITGLKTPTTLAEQVAVNDSIVAALVTLGLVTDGRT